MNCVHIRYTYRMIANEKCTKEEIITSHRDAIGVRSGEETVLLAIQDTMSVNYGGHEKTEGIGYNCDKTLAIVPEPILTTFLREWRLGILSEKACRDR